MRKTLLFIVSVLCASACMAVNDTIAIPLTMSVFAYLPQDGPTGSTPDPTDPNQFRASLTGNTLVIRTQTGAVSFVVVQEETASRQGEDYFYAVSYGSVSCPIVREGLYTIKIGYWKTDFTGFLRVQRIALFDFYGHSWQPSLTPVNDLPPGLYAVRVETTLGNTTFKFYKQP